jgi:NAD(P)-dependent dehydrogenase (short-subunit alcohol dehydrogenase family)
MAQNDSGSRSGPADAAPGPTGDGTAMKGRVALVTGATDGIGLVTARELARDGAIVVGVGRREEKCRRVEREIRDAAGNAEVHFITADLSAMDEVRRTAEAVRSGWDRLDVLVNNVGVYWESFKETADGIEATWATNHLCPFLLTNLLADRLAQSAPARVVTVSSQLHEGQKIDFDDLEMRGDYDGLKQYGRSKLANLMFAFALARRMADKGVTSNGLHPGFVNTTFGHENEGWIARGLKMTQKIMAISPEKGARTSLYLARSGEVADRTGDYFVKCKPKKPNPLARSEAAQERLWDACAKMTGLDG